MSGMKIFCLICAIIGVLMILGGAFMLCWPAIIFLKPFAIALILVGVMIAITLGSAVAMME